MGGDVTEVALWFNAVRRPGVRRAALLLGPQGAAELTSAEDFDGGPAAPVGPVEGYLYEPDGAVIRAGLVADVALQLGGHLLDEHIAYICAPELLDTPFARAYKVLEVMPYNVKALKSWVKDNGIGVLDIKKRGTSVTPEELRKQLLPGKRQQKGQENGHPGPHQDRRGPGGHLGGARLGLVPAGLLGPHEVLGGTDLLVGGPDPGVEDELLQRLDGGHLGPGDHGLAGGARRP